jgi:DNA replication protein DnaD
MVNHNTEEWEWRGEKYICKPGQKITSLQNIAKEAGKGISVKNVRTALERFQKLEFLANESTNQNRLITVLNWELYQSQDTEPASKQASDRQTGGKRVATNKNEKNDKNDKKYKIIRRTLEIAIEDFKEFRKKIKKPMTDRAVELLIDKLNKLASDDETKIAILDQSIVNGWQGIFPLKEDTQRQSGTNNPFLQEDI